MEGPKHPTDRARLESVASPTRFLRWVLPGAAVGALVAVAMARWLPTGRGEPTSSMPPLESSTGDAGQPLSLSPEPPPRPAAPEPLPSSAPHAEPSIDPSALQRAEDLLARALHAEAEQLVDELLGTHPYHPRLRDLQARITVAAQRAAEDALGQAQQARAEAGIAAGADLAKGPFEAAKRREAEGMRLANGGRWIEARLEWLEAARLFQEAENLAWLEGARQRCEQARARAVDAGAPRTAPDRFAEAQAAASRAQAAQERRDLAAAVRDFESATAGFDGARVGALEAAAAQRRAAALEADRQAIAAVLAGYAAALEGKDLARLKSLWPTLGEAQEAKIRESFLFAQTLDVGLQLLDLRVQGEAATAVCRRRDRIVTEEGQKAESDRRAEIRLRRGPDGWVIEGIQ